MSRPGFRHQRVADRICRVLNEQLGFAVSTVAVDVSSAARTDLLPRRRGPARLASYGDEVAPANLVDLVVEVRSPGNRRAEREAERASYAAAEIPTLWEVLFDGGVELRAQQFTGGRYVEGERWPSSRSRCSCAPPQTSPHRALTSTKRPPPKRTGV